MMKAMIKPKMTLVQVVHSFGFGAVAQPQEGREMGLMLAVEAPPHIYESWEGLIATNAKTLRAWLGWMENQRRAFEVGKSLGSFELMGAKFEAIRKYRKLYLALAAKDLLLIQGLRFEGNPLKWPDWSAPMYIVRMTLEAALANNTNLVELAVSHRAQPTEVVPHFNIPSLR